MLHNGPCWLCEKNILFYYNLIDLCQYLLTCSKRCKSNPDRILTANQCHYLFRRGAEARVVLEGRLVTGFIHGGQTKDFLVATAAPVQNGKIESLLEGEGAKFFFISKHSVWCFTLIPTCDCLISITVWWEAKLLFCI